MTLTASRSVELLVAAQTRWGSVPASTEHKVYQFGWLRDGSWCAYAFDVAGHHEQAQATPDRHDPDACRAPVVPHRHAGEVGTDFADRVLEAPLIRR